MNLKYINYFNSKHKRKMKKIYINSFPKEERFPFWIIKKCAKSNNVFFNEILDDNKIIGIEYLILDNNVAYLMYFSIEKNKRNKGYGSIILKNLIKKYNTTLLSIELVKSNNIITKKRKNFYLKNGFYETNKYTEQNKVTYEILCSNNNYDITKNDLISIYKKMTNSKLLGYLIDKKFNLYNICFIEG